MIFIRKKYLNVKIKNLECGMLKSDAEDKYLGPLLPKKLIWFYEWQIKEGIMISSDIGKIKH